MGVHLVLVVDIFSLFVVVGPGVGAVDGLLIATTILLGLVVVDALADEGPVLALFCFADGVDAVEDEPVAMLVVPAHSAAELDEAALVGHADGKQEVEAEAVHGAEVDAFGVALVDDDHGAGLEVAAVGEAEVVEDEVGGHFVGDGLAVFAALDVDEARIDGPAGVEEVIPGDVLEVREGAAHGRNVAVLDGEAEMAEQLLLESDKAVFDGRGGEADDVSHGLVVAVELAIFEHEAVHFVVELHVVGAILPTSVVETDIEVDLGLVLHVALHVEEGPLVLLVKDLVGEAHDDILAVTVVGHEKDEAEKRAGLAGAGRLLPDLPVDVVADVEGGGRDGVLHLAGLQVEGGELGVDVEVPGVVVGFLSVRDGGEVFRVVIAHILVRLFVIVEDEFHVLVDGALALDLVELRLAVVVAVVAAYIGAN